MNNILVIYHGKCMDGFTSAWVANKALTEMYEPKDLNLTFYAGEHGKTIPFDLCDGKLVYFVDFSYRKDIIEQILWRAKKVIVLDHHISAKGELDQLSQYIDKGELEVVFDVERSGAGITWDYFFPQTPRPLFVDYVEDRDIWKLALPLSKEVNSALFSYDYTFENWDTFEKNPITKYQDEGIHINRKHMKDIRELAEHKQLLKIGGVEVPVVNANYTYGTEIAALLTKGLDTFAGYYWVDSDGNYQFGLRSDNNGGMDVSKIAASYGGGGHKHASGFKLSSLDEL